MVGREHARAPRLRLKLAAALAGLLFSVVLAELLLRALGLGYGNVHMESSPVLHHVHASDHRFVSYHRSREYGGHVVRYDRNGLRVAAAQTSDAGSAGEGDLVVAFMGDSFVEALQVAYEESFVGRLQAQAGRRARVPNFGTSSYSPLLYLLQWRVRVRHLRPAHVFLMLYENDVRDDQLMTERARYDEEGRVVAVPGPAESWMTRAGRRSFLGRFLNRTWLQLSWAWEHRGEARGSQPTYYVEENPDISDPTDGYLRKLVSTVREAGVELTLMAVPSKARSLEAARRGHGDVFNDKVRAWAAGNGVRFVDLATAFYAAADRGVRPFFDRDIHFTAAGHAVVAEVIAREFPELFSAPAAFPGGSSSTPPHGRP